MMKPLTVMTFLVATALAGCGTEKGTPSSAEEPATDVWSSMSLTEIMSRTFSADYDPVATPAIAASAADIAVRGRVVTVEEGRAVSLDGDAPDHYVTFGIETDQVLEEDPGQVGKLIYFELPRPDNLSADTFAAAVPAGTQVALFGYSVNESVGEVAGQYNGREPGATLYRPDAQGLFTEAAGQPMESVLEPLDDMSRAWRQLDSLDELVNAVE